MQLPKAETVLAKIQSDLEEGIERLLEMCAKEIGTMTGVNTIASVPVDEEIPGFALLECEERLRAEGWIVDAIFDDAGDRTIMISLPTLQRQREYEFRAKALRELLLACDNWAPDSGDTRGHFNSPHDNALRDAIWYARNRGIVPPKE